MADFRETGHLPPDRGAALRERCRRLLPGESVEITAVAWAAAGRA